MTRMKVASALLATARAERVLPVPAHHRTKKGQVRSGQVTITIRPPHRTWGPVEQDPLGRIYSQSHEPFRVQQRNLHDLSELLLRKGRSIHTHHVYVCKCK